MITGAMVFGLRIDTKFKRRVVVAATYGSYVALSILGSNLRNGSGAIGLLGMALTGLLLFSGWLALTG